MKRLHPFGYEKFMPFYLKLNADNVKIYSKDKKYKFLWKVIHYILLILTFGKMNKFYSRYTTTIGNSIFFHAGWTPDDANASSYVTLKHEYKHVLDYRKEGLVKMGFKYLFLPFPIKFARCRYKYERKAYLEGFKAIIELGFTPKIEKYVDILTGPEYLWAWHNKDEIRQWFTNQIDKHKRSISGQRTM
jgi:hypothetical protein